MRSHSESGQTTILVLGLALVAFAIAGLAVDGTRAFLLRRSLQNAADSAAVGAAGELDTSSLYSTGGRSVALDPGAARAQAIELLSGRSLPARASIRADATGVTVVLRASLPTTFLGVVGVKAVPIAAEARAEPFSGAAP